MINAIIDVKQLLFIIYDVHTTLHHFTVSILLLVNKEALV